MHKILFFLMAIGLFSANAQEIVVLYPEGTPGLKTDHGLTEADVSDRNDGIVRLRNVSIPTLTVFKPSAKKNTGAAVIICPGGGYQILAWNHEGTNFGEWFAARGMTAFVLKYRLPQEEMFTEKQIRPLQDAQQSFRYIRKNAGKYGVDTAKVGIMGFSAGGHLAATASTHFDLQVGEIVDGSLSVRPDYSLLIYPVVSFNDKFGHSGSRKNLIGPELKIADMEEYSNELHIEADTPPAFLVHANDDGVSADNSLAYVSALREQDIEAELHLYTKGGHGFGLANKKEGPVQTWTLRLEDWLKQMGYVK